MHIQGDQLKGTTILTLEGDSLDYLKFFEQNPDTCGGDYVLRGTRVTVRTVLASLAEGATLDEILEDFPSLTQEQVRAVIAFAAEAASDDFPTPSIPKVA